MLFILPVNRHPLKPVWWAESGATSYCQPDGCGIVASPLSFHRHLWVREVLLTTAGDVGVLAPAGPLLTLLHLGGDKTPHFCSPVAFPHPVDREYLITDEPWYESPDSSPGLL